jgi:hypothetical protein
VDESDKAPSQPSNTPVRWPQTGFDHLKLQYHPLVQLLYPAAEEVIVERELGGGFGGATVLLVQPINRQGRRLARQIVKVGLEAELRLERENCAQHVEKEISLIAPRLDNYVQVDDMAAISYIFVGEGVLGQTRSLEDYYSQASAEEVIQTLKHLLDEGLGQSWYGQTRPHTCSFAQEYGRHLAEHLRLKLRPASADGIWQAAEAPTAIEDYRRLTEEEIVPAHRDISPGDLLRIDGLLVSRVKYNELKLQHPTNPGIVVKVERRPGSQIALAFSPGDKVTVQGEVSYNRQSRLEAIVQMAFSGFSETMVDVQQEKLNWQTEAAQYPNPLKLYPEVLNQILRSRKSIVHGDLHLRNILVDQVGRGWLIDFARVTERHNLYDFIKLETYIRQMILSQENCQFSFAEYRQFEEALAAALLDRSALVPEQPNLQKAYQVIRSLRELAAHYMGYPADFHGEYFPALFLYSLAVLKYYENHGAKAARLAFATAAVVGRVLTEDEPSTAPASTRPASAPGSPPPATAKEGKGVTGPQVQPTLTPEDEQFLREQLAQHEQNRRHLLRQKSIYGAGEVPLHLLNQIRAEEEEISNIKQQLGE